MIGRIAWFVGLAGIGLLTAALQLDLSAARAPQIAPLVPEPLRAYAQQRIVEDAILGKKKAAVAEAQKLVRRRPMPAENLSLLAGAQAVAGNQQAALGTIQVAGRRGWREPAAQEAMLRLALAAGDRPEAARRYIALFVRSKKAGPLLTELGPAVFDGPDSSGRDTMTAIVVGAKRWHNGFLERGSQVMPPSAFAAIAADSIARGARFDCQNLETSIRTLLRRDAAAGERLRAAAQKRCPGAAR
ncbi:hypothetical protein [Erythrobacter sp. CCH5-A1]|jgi:hypothetical protein|uniref:hypothetical protein n=1 Tax=Erythrobacter sp. CCH5-A1 TaxID=1768792 RepID=UPI000829D726|nr:hypothetical protein [Erythrobacter sp. CCH5-A1]